MQIHGGARIGARAVGSWKGVGAICGAALVASSAACSLLVSRDGLSDGTHGAPFDAGIHEAAATPTDATAPPVTSTDSGDDDSASLPGPDVDATSHYCASQSPSPLFCDDFDQGALPGSWDTINTVGGTLTEDAVTADSPPRSLLLKPSALAVGQPFNLALRKHVPLPAPPTVLHFDFSLDPVAIDTTANAAIVFSTMDFFDGSNNRYSVQLTIFVRQGMATVELGEQSGFTDGGASYVGHAMVDPLPLGAWTAVGIEVDWAGARIAQGRVTFGGAQEVSIPLSMTVTPTALQIVIGSSYETLPSPGWQLRYDNVRLTSP